MTITVNELSLQAINAALLRIQRSIQTGNNNFQNDVEKAVANVTISGKTVIQKYDDSRLMAIVNELNQRYETLTREQSSLRSKIVNLETILSNVSLAYDPLSNTISYTLGDYSTDLQLKDTTYTFSYDTDTGTFTIVDEYTGETVFNQVFNDTTYTFSFTNGILTVHNNRLNTEQTFNFDSRYYTEAEIQSLILDKIPPEASSSNQLADKAFVNSSISTATATFRGTVTTTQALEALTGDLNDYAYLQNIDPTTGQTISYDRYKWVESGGDYGHWKYEYTLNNSSFTSDQWAAINSGITCQIVTDLLDGCYSGNGSALCKSNGNEWRNLLSTNCDCTGSVNADYIYYNTNIQANQCTGALLANCYCVKGHGYATFAAQNIAASDIGLTAGCTYPLSCILESIMACCGYNAGTYTFKYANAEAPLVQETGGYAYVMSFTKEDRNDPVNYPWSFTRWTIKNSLGSIYTARAQSTNNAGIVDWVVRGLNFSYICDAISLNKDANTVTRRIIANEQIANGVGYRTRIGLGLCRGTSGWSKALLSVGCNDAGTCFWDYCFDNQGHIGNACVVKTCYLNYANGTRRYVKIKTLVGRNVCSVSFDFDFWRMNGTINLDCSVGEYTGDYYGGLQVARCDSCCACCDCFWISYDGYRSLVLKSVYEFEVEESTTTAPEGVTFSCLSRRLGSVCKVAANQNNDYNLLMSSANNNTRIDALGSSSCLTFNPSTGTLETKALTTDYKYTNSYCKQFTPSGAGEVWIHVGCFTAGDTTTKYTNTQDLTLVAGSRGMVSAVHLTILSSSALNPFIKMDKTGYFSNTGISCILITRTGSAWNCVNNVYVRVLPYTAGSTTYAFNFSLYRNQITTRWSTCMNYCSDLPSETVVWDSGCLMSSYNDPVVGINHSLHVGTCSADCPFILIDCDYGGRMISLSKAIGCSVGLLFAHNSDWSGAACCTLGIELGSSVNRGFYHCKNGTTFEWLQYWDANTEKHTCPQCFACSIYGCSNAYFAGTVYGCSNAYFAGTVSSCNTLRRSTVYSASTYNSGWYLVAQLSSNENAAGNHDITLGGYIDMTCGAAPNLRRLCFKTTIRGNKCTYGASYAFIEPYYAADYLRITREINTTNCAFTLRVYAKISGYYSRINTTIDYYGGGDVNALRGLNSSAITFPNSYVADEASMTGTQITLNSSGGYSWQSVYSGCHTITPQCQYFIMKVGPINAGTVGKLDFLLCTSVDGTDYPSKICGTLIPGNAGTNAYNPDLINASFTSTRCALYPLSIGFDSTCCLVFAFAYQCGCTFRPQLFFKNDQFNKALKSVNISFLCCASDTTNYRTYVMANMSCQCDSGMFVTAVNANQVSANCLSTYSKRSLKKDITPYMGCALNLIGNTNVVSYRYKTESENSLVHIGFIADDTPELLSGENKDTMRINDSVGILLKAVQELDERTLPFWKKITNIVRKLIRRFRNGKKD